MDALHPVQHAPRALGLVLAAMWIFLPQARPRSGVRVQPPRTPRRWRCPEAAGVLAADPRETKDLCGAGPHLAFRSVLVSAARLPAATVPTVRHTGSATVPGIARGFAPARGWEEAPH